MKILFKYKINLYESMWNAYTYEGIDDNFTNDCITIILQKFMKSDVNYN